MSISIKVATKKYAAVIQYYSDKSLILESGATLGVESASLDSALKSLRAANTTTTSGVTTTNVDLLFKSKSAIASFIVGSPQSGNRFFAKYLQNTSNPQTLNNNVSGTNAQNVVQSTNQVPNESQAPNSPNELVNDIKVFCKDFEFDPDPRCLNTMAYQQDVDNYLVNFMKIIGYDESILAIARNKFRSCEWQRIVERIKAIPKTHGQINNRLIILYGSAGTGKTTYALQNFGSFEKGLVDAEGNPIPDNMVIASASADPDEIFTRFDPVTKTYVLSPIGLAMVEGKKVIIDEANFYCSECLARLQGVTDNKKAIIDNGILIPIKDGFGIVITMNLHTNTGGSRPLPNPLVSRAQIIDDYDNHPNQDLGWVW